MEIMIFFFVWLLVIIIIENSLALSESGRCGFVAALRLSAAAVPGPLATRPY
jgi:hypothetical protein